MKKVIIVDIIAILFAMLFLYAAISKVITFNEFQAQIGKSPLIMNHAKWIAWTIPAIEIIVACFLYIPKLRLFALYGCFYLMLMFTAYITIILKFSPYIPCSCGGILSSLGWTEHLVFNITFVILSVVAIFSYDDSEIPESIEYSLLKTK